MLYHAVKIGVLNAIKFASYQYLPSCLGISYDPYSSFLNYQFYIIFIDDYIPYKNKYWRGTKFGELANRHAIAKFKSRQYIFV